jgi:hypothetical protein
MSPPKGTALPFPDKRHKDKRLARTAAPPQRPARPPELQDVLNARLFHPLAWRLALALRNSFVTPNQLSVAGGVLVVLAAIAYANAETLALVALGFALHLGWHVLDGADGDLARLTGRSSRQGEIIDGICDYASHIVLYLTLSWLLAEQIGWTGWVLGPLAGASRIIQAMFYESQRRQYQFWVYRVEWLRVSAGDGGSGGGVIEALGRGYARLAQGLTPAGAQVDALVAAAQGAEAEALRTTIRARYAGVLRFITPLSANYRTLAIGLAMLAGSPLWAFVFEIVVLGVWLAASMQVARRAAHAIIAQAVASISR